MSFQIESTEGYALVTIEAEKLNGAIAPNLKTELVKLSEEGAANIVIDLTQVKYADSSGLSAILVGNRLCKNSGGTLVISGLQPMVEKLINISKLNNFLNITPTADEGIDYIFMESVQKELDNE